MERTSRRNSLPFRSCGSSLPGHPVGVHDECNSIVCAIELRICRKHDQTIFVRGGKSFVDFSSREILVCGSFPGFPRLCFVD